MKTCSILVLKRQEVNQITGGTGIINIIGNNIALLSAVSFFGVTAAVFKKYFLDESYVDEISRASVICYEYKSELKYCQNKGIPLNKMNMLRKFRRICNATIG